MTNIGKRRVVITGMGCVTPVGNDLDSTWDALVAGKSGAAEITQLDVSNFDVKFANEVKNFDPQKYIDARECRRLDRFVHFAVASAKMALDQAGFKPGLFKAERFGCVYGSGIGGILSIEEQYERYKVKGTKRVSPFTIPLLMINCAPGQLAIMFGCKGPNYGTVTACASATHAIGLSMRHIQWGEADVMLTGGSEAGISILGVSAFTNMGALSTRRDDPQTASRPFDKERDGFVMGEGSGTLLLEEYEHAKERGAKIYAEILGYGFTDDAFHITAPEETGDGGARAMSIAIENSGLKPEQIDYINAHGTSTPYNDKTETLAIKKAFGLENSKKLSISSTKGQTGHLLGAAGAIETIFSTMVINSGIIPPTINRFTPDPDCDLDTTPNQPGKREVNYVLTNNLGFGGHNATLCLGKID